MGLDFDFGVVKALASGALSSAGSRSGRAGRRLRRGWSEYSVTEAGVREKGRDTAKERKPKKEWKEECRDQYRQLVSRAWCDEPVNPCHRADRGLAVVLVGVGFVFLGLFGLQIVASRDPCNWVNLLPKQEGKGRAGRSCFFFACRSPSPSDEKIGAQASSLHPLPPRRVNTVSARTVLLRFPRAPSPSLWSAGTGPLKGDRSAAMYYRTT